MEEFLIVLIQQFKLFWVLALNERSHIHAHLFNILYLLFGLPQPILGRYQEDGLTHPLIITAFFSFFVSKVTGNITTMSF